MRARIIPLHRRETARVEATRLDGIIAALAELAPAREGWEGIERQFDLQDMGEAEWEAWDRLKDLEDAFLKRALDPGFLALLECIRDQVADIAEGRP